MTVQLNLQRDSEIFFSNRDISSGNNLTNITPSNTYKVEILAGFATSQAAGTQDLSSSESGLNPDRSSRRFNINMQPVDWNFQAYLRPTGIERTSNIAAGSTTGNVKPVCDWFLWQALLSNTTPAFNTKEQSAWQDNGTFDMVERAGAANVAPHTANFGIAQENHIYVKMSNVIYQIANAAIESAEVNGSIDGIATTTWTGKGTQLIELTGGVRDIAVAVFGGIQNAGTLVAANANSYAMTAPASYHPWAVANVFSVQTGSSFIKNRLGTVVLNHTTEAGVSSTYTFPVTNMSLTIKNNLTYLTPEEMSKLNLPIGQFAGAREITGSVSAYLRGGNGDTAQFFRNIQSDGRPNFSTVANANIKIGGAVAPYVAFYMPAAQFSIPVHNIQDYISLDIDFKAQEAFTDQGTGRELIIFVKKG